MLIYELNSESFQTADTLVTQSVNMRNVEM